MLDTSHPVYDFGASADRYDRWYDTPDGRTQDRCQKALVGKLLPPPGAGRLLLDVGCGTGHWSAFFASIGFKVAGVDISPEMVGVARSKKLARCRFHLGDAHHLPFRSDSFDIVAAMALLEFIKSPEAAILEMARVLRPGGSMIVGTLNRLNPLNRRRVARGDEPYASAHMFSLKELRDSLSEFGRVRVEVSCERVEEGGSVLFRRLWRLLRYGRASHGSLLVALVRTQIQLLNT